MEWFKEIWNQISTILKWWVIILPWEEGVRIRLGKNVKILKPGIHFRLPYFDSCYRQSIRINFVNFATQTLTTSTKETITISAIVGYSIKDIFKVYNSVSKIEGAVTGKVMGAIADFVSRMTLVNCKPSDIEDSVKSSIGEMDWGINIEELKITSYAVVKTYRLIQEGSWMSKDHKLDAKV